MNTINLCNTPIIIGGCGSSGTTLIRAILNAHSKIHCGKELSIFCQYQLYECNDITHFKKNLISGEINNWVGKSIWAYKTNFTINFIKELFDDKEIDLMFNYATNINDFFSIFFTNYAEKNGKEIWAEKTPANIECISEILRLFDNCKFIHVIRNPWSVVSSLIIRRGLTFQESLERWMFSMECAVKEKDNSRVYGIMYEDIILNTENEIRKLLKFLDIDFEEQVLRFYEIQREGSPIDS